MAIVSKSLTDPRIPRARSHFDLVMASESVCLGRQIGQVREVVKRHSVENGLVIIDLDAGSGMKQSGFFDYSELKPVEFQQRQ